MKSKIEIEKNDSTEEKIKQAARKVFTQKGYAATRTRDIAEESGYNLALINYYFRSKEKLFEIVMLEHMQTFFNSIVEILDDPATSLKEKIEILVNHYINMLIKNPALPLFVINEITADPANLISKIGIDKLQHQHLFIVKQWKEMVTATQRPTIKPMHIAMNLISMIIFPFIGNTIIRNRNGINMDEFIALMEERKKLIPVWIEAIVSVS